MLFLPQYGLQSWHPVCTCSASSTQVKSGKLAFIHAFHAPSQYRWPIDVDPLSMEEVGSGIDTECDPVCFNDGQCVASADNPEQLQCQCPKGFLGPDCTIHEIQTRENTTFSSPTPSPGSNDTANSNNTQTDLFSPLRRTYYSRGGTAPNGWVITEHEVYNVTKQFTVGMALSSISTTFSSNDFDVTSQTVDSSGDLLTFSKITKKTLSQYVVFLQQRV